MSNQSVVFRNTGATQLTFEFPVPIRATGMMVYGTAAGGGGGAGHNASGAAGGGGGSGMSIWGFRFPILCGDTWTIIVPPFTAGGIVGGAPAANGSDLRIDSRLFGKTILKLRGGQRGVAGSAVAGGNGGHLAFVTIGAQFAYARGGINGAFPGNWGKAWIQQALINPMRDVAGSGGGAGGDNAAVSGGSNMYLLPLTVDVNADIDYEMGRMAWIPTLAAGDTAATIGNLNAGGCGGSNHFGMGGAGGAAGNAGTDANAGTSPNFNAGGGGGGGGSNGNGGAGGPGLLILIPLYD